MINTLIFVAGINTLMQTWLGTRVPVVIGGSYAFIIPTITIALSTNSSTNVIFLSPRQVSLVPSLISRMHFSNFYAVVFFYWENMKGNDYIMARARGNLKEFS